ncbi:rod shape-determining protein MreD [Pyrinomonas methylaliphatogenes]|jgi:rod shape-determining protein MreD|uniref:Rod shape-determining protein MreD n=1 Tax=Pyrinomonas methylaliphatogenes TaxID=454194 RepID=A0A0B6WWY0_9BACT|nr:rod shape-determining protein MreD [Pyrinomonas methylaliphatogenes]MBX5478567.1 rod shape-determining protein MreD [Pyrinomonas methylaliphatogenes]CDM65252.1 rod shape-determining protein MreD [Pyrinomonas methylaliphatogenes]
MSIKIRAAIAIALVVAIQAALRVVWPPSVYLDLPLIVVVHYALKYDAVQAVVIGGAIGLAVDALSGGLLGAGGFSRTLIAYIIAALSTRVMLNTPLMRILVLAGATALDAIVYALLHAIFNQPLIYPFAETLAFKLIATTIGGTILMLIYDYNFGERAQRRRQFAVRRRLARRLTNRHL